MTFATNLGKCLVVYQKVCTFVAVFRNRKMKKREYYIGRTIGKLRGQIFRLQRHRYQKAAVQLTVEEAILLNMVNERTNQISQNLAQVTGKNKSVVMRLLDSLENKGLLLRSQNPDDRRENLLTLTEQGKKVVRQYSKIERSLSKDLLAGATEEDVDAFFRVADVILNNGEKLLQG